MVVSKFFRTIFILLKQNDKYALAAAKEGSWEDRFGEISFFNRFPAGARKEAIYQKDYFVKNDPGEVPLINQPSDAGHTYYCAPIPFVK